MMINGKAFWASLQTPNTTFDPCWQIDIALDKANKKIVEAAGLTIKNKGDDRGDFVSVKRKVARKDGKENQAPVVIDDKLRPFNDLIGNGSVVNVKINTFDWDFKGKTGVGADLVKVQVVEHVSYAGATDDEDFQVIGGDEDGFDDIPLANAG